MSAEADKHQQSKSVFVVNVEGKRTTGPLLIGLLDYFQRCLPKVGYFEVHPGGGLHLICNGRIMRAQYSWFDRATRRAASTVF